MRRCELVHLTLRDIQQLRNIRHEKRMRIPFEAICESRGFLVRVFSGQQFG